MLIDSSIKYDAIIILGRGITKKGELTPSGIACTKKAVELYHQGLSEILIFSGHWSYKLDFIPARTEAMAMAELAASLGIPKKSIFIEEDSVSTVSNLINVRKRFLEPMHLIKVGVICYYPLEKRTLLNLKKVLGPKYNYKLIDADFCYSSLKEKEVLESEERKYKVATKFLKAMKDGDYIAIEEELKKFHKGL